MQVVCAAECGRDGGTPPVLLVCPPPIRATGPDAAEYETVAAKARTLASRFAEAVASVGAKLRDLDGVASYAEADPIHLGAAAHGGPGADG